MDWSVCIICGTEIGELLKRPIDSLQKDSGLEVHATFLQNVGKFEELDALPVKVYLSREITPELLLKCWAAWHKSCHLKSSNSKLELVSKKRKRDECDGEPSSVYFLWKRWEPSRVHDIAGWWKIVGSDMVVSKAKYHKACMTYLANRYRTVLRQGLDAKMNDEDKKNKARAWVELKKNKRTLVAGKEELKFEDLQESCNQLLKFLAAI